MSLRTPAQLVLKSSLVPGPAMLAMNNQTHMISDNTRVTCRFSKGIERVSIEVSRPGVHAMLRDVNFNKNDDITLLGYSFTCLGMIQTGALIKALILWVEMENGGIKE